MDTGTRGQAVEAANEALRAYVQARRGRCCWSAEERAELDRLRSAWLDAVRQGIDVAA